MKTTKVYFPDQPSKSVILYKTDLMIFDKPVFVEKTKLSWNFYIDCALIVRVFKDVTYSFDAAKTDLADRMKRSKIDKEYLNKYIETCLLNTNPENETI
jgi:hypothetical protein